MKKIFFALMAVAAIAMTVCIGCEKKSINEPEPPENIKLLQDTVTGNQNKWGINV